jgi:hypothetical protein
MVSLAIVVQRPNWWVRLQVLGTRHLIDLDATSQSFVVAVPIPSRQ